jgi:hypothetical protein
MVHVRGYASIRLNSNYFARRLECYISCLYLSKWPGLVLRRKVLARLNNLLVSSG